MVKSLMSDVLRENQWRLAGEKSVVVTFRPKKVP
jgi:hypothetical protein